MIMMNKMNNIDEAFGFQVIDDIYDGED